MTTPVTKVTVLSSEEHVLAFKMMTGICVVMAPHVAMVCLAVCARVV